MDPTSVGLVALIGLLIYSFSGPDADDVGSWGVAPGNYVAGGTPLSWTDAKAYCEGEGWQLASIHSELEMAQAATACAMKEIGTHWGDTEKPNGCWIGLNAAGRQEGVFEWSDRTVVDYLNFYSGEPNQCSSADLWDANHCGHAGEKYVEMQSNWGYAWNDNGIEGSYTHDVETLAARQADDPSATVSARGMYPLCLKTASTEQALSGEGFGQASPTWTLPTPSCRAEPAYGQSHDSRGRATPAVKDPNTGKWNCPLEQDGTKPNFVLLPYTSSATQAEDLCKSKGYRGLASLHDLADVNHAKELCGTFAMNHKVIKGLPHSCWIGLSDKAQEGGFAWMDGTAVEYLNWSPGEPNEWGGEESGEDYVSMRYDGTRGGAWNDANVLGEAGHAQRGQQGGHTMEEITGCHGCYGAPGYYPLCEEKRPHSSQNGPWEWQTLTGAEEGRFKVLPRSLPLAQAKAACEADGMHGLASIHSREEQQQASKACRQVASVDAELQHGVSEGCWIGLTDAVERPGSGIFRWTDGSAVNFLNWNSGEPNECVGCGGEDGVEIDFRWGSRDGYEFGGGWNDANDFGRAGAAVGLRTVQATHDACWGCWGAVGYFPVCQTQPAAAATGPVMTTEWNTPTKYGTCVGSTGQATPIQFQPGSNTYQCPMTAGYVGAPTHPPTCPGANGQPARFQQYRFLIENVRGEGAAAQSSYNEQTADAGTVATDTNAANSVQIAEFKFYAGAGKTAEIRCLRGCQVTNPGGDNPQRGGDTCTYDQNTLQEVCTTSGLHSELAPMTVDGDPNTKWLDFGMVRSGLGGHHQGSQLIFAGGDLAQANIVGYSFTTANDAPERDPASWRFQGCESPAGVTCTEQQWINLDIRTSYSAPNTRGAETHEFAVGCAGQVANCAQTQLTGGATCQGMVDHSQRAFIAMPKPEAWDSSRLLCKRNFGPHADLASIHSAQQQQIAVETCSHLTSGETLEGGIPHSCWIGLNDVKSTLTNGEEGEAMFTWVDKSSVDFITFAPGEPNNVGDNGEDVTEVDVRAGRTGAWNDNNNLGEAGNGEDMAGCYGCYGTFGNYPLCETHAPAHSGTEIGHATGYDPMGSTHTTCKIDQSRDGGPNIMGKGCEGTYQACCMPIQEATSNQAGAGDICLFGSCTLPGGGGRRALTEDDEDETRVETFANGTAKPVTARTTRVVHTINETKWVNVEEISDSDHMIMDDLNEFFGDKVYIWGCTASNALNYNPEATMEAGTCEYHEDQPAHTRMY